MQQQGENWYLPETADPDLMINQFAGKFDVYHQPEQTQHVIYTDSFDWRLYANGFYLLNRNTQWSLLEVATGKVVLEATGPKLGKGAFAKDFPQGPMRELLSEMLEMRCVSAVASGDIITRESRILNKDEKTVVRLYLEKHTVDGVDTQLQALRLEPVRGYVQELETVRKKIKGLEPVEAPLGFVALDIGCQAQGRNPGDYSSKIKLNLDPDQTAKSAVTVIYKQLLEAMRTYLPGTLVGLDSEFLHDFRVAIRRTRSGLSLIKKVLPEEVVIQYKADFAYLGKITGPVRDLDVYLLYEDDYKNRLPESLQQGLHTFFENLAQARSQEQKKLVKALQGEKVQKILTSWGEYLDKEDKEPAKFADAPVVDIAKRIIYRRYKRVLDDGLAITESTPDEEVHRLRIQGKKLRYAIEFFSSLFSDKDIRTAVRRLKKLQNYLGDFNDLSVQQDVLREYLNKTRPGSRKNLDLGAALGALMSNLHQEQVKARGDFSEVFATFSGKKNTALFEQLFS